MKLTSRETAVGTHHSTFEDSRLDNESLSFTLKHPIPTQILEQVTIAYIFARRTLRAMHTNLLVQSLVRFQLSLGSPDTPKQTPPRSNYIYVASTQEAQSFPTAVAIVYSAASVLVKIVEKDGLFAPETPDPVLLYSAKSMKSVIGLLDDHSDQISLFIYAGTLS